MIRNSKSTTVKNATTTHPGLREEPTASSAAAKHRGSTTRRRLTLASACLVAAATGLAGAADAAVTGQHARDTWDRDGCAERFSIEEAFVTGDITRDGRTDAVMLWTCSTGAGGAQPRILNYWIDGRRIRQKSLTIPLPKASSLVLLAGRVIVQGGDYSGPSVARCCPDLEVTLTYQWKRNRLVMTKKTVLPTSSDATLRSRATRGEAPLLSEADAS